MDTPDLLAAPPSPQGLGSALPAAAAPRRLPVTPAAVPPLQPSRSFTPGRRLSRIDKGLDGPPKV